MFRLLRYLFTGDGHLHKWEVYKDTHVSTLNGAAGHTRLYLRCSVCGNIKIVNGNSDYLTD